MANLERGAPSDDVRVFDGGEDDDDVEGSRLPLLIVIALLVLAAFGAVVWLAYQKGVERGHSEVPRVIAAEPGPAKVAPTNPGGTATPYTGLKIYQQPAPSEDGGSAEAVPPPAAPPVTKPNTMAGAKPQILPTVPMAAPAKPVAASTPAANPPAKPTMTAAAPAPAKPIAATMPPPKPAPVKPAVETKPTPVQVAVVPSKPATMVPAKPVVTPAAPPAGAGLLQIGSYKSQAEADAAWTAYKAKHASMLAGLSPDVQQADLGAKGTWYRLRIVTGSKDAAAALCTKLKADGSACIPVR